MLAPGTVIISSFGSCSDINKIVTPVATEQGGDLYYIDFSKDEFHLGGSSFAQSIAAVGNQTPELTDPAYFKKVFNALQLLIHSERSTAGHDIGSGGLITTLLEMCFPSLGIGMNLDLSVLEEPDTIRCLFSEKIAVVVQSKENLESILSKEGVHAVRIGHVSKSDHLNINGLILSVLEMRRLWMQTSTALEIEQTLPELAQTRAENIINQPLDFKFPKGFSGALPATKSKKIKANSYERKEVIPNVKWPM